MYFYKLLISLVFMVLVTVIKDCTIPEDGG